MILADIAMAVLPVTAYIPQYQILKEQKSIGSFSIYICAILLISNILRIFFWLTVGFAMSLLVQAVLMVAMQLFLLKQCVEVSDHSIKEMALWKKFWKWETYQQYLKFLLGLTAIMTVVTLFAQIFTFGYFGETIGLVSMSIQAMLGMPQAYANWSKKSVEGLSIKMIGMWFLGDFSKTCYFIIERQPFQFILCGVIQLTVDIIIIGQILNYSKTQYNEVKNITDPTSE